MKTLEKAGLGCLVLILLLFGSIGVACGVGAWMVFAGGNWRKGLVLAILALAFGGVGFGLLGALLYQRQTLFNDSKGKAAHPHEPWLWRADWRAKRVRSTSPTGLFGTWLFAGLWNLVCLGFVTVPAETYWRDIQRAPWIVPLALLFPIIGLWLLFLAIRETWRHKKFGVSWLELALVPVPPGSALAATLRPPPLAGAEAVKLKLSCIQRIERGSGDNRTSHEQILWQEEQWLKKVDEVPVYFPIPAEAVPTSLEDHDCQITWRLAASVELPGLDYQAFFEVPVFPHAGPPQALPDAAAPYRLVEHPTPEPAGSDKIQVVEGGRGCLRIDFLARRSPKAALAATCFLLFLGCFFLLAIFEAPSFFPVVLGLLELLLLALTLSLWFGTTSVLIENGVLKIEKGLLGYRRAKVIPLDQIADVKPAIGMQVGSTVYYDVKVWLKDGKKITAGSSIASKRQAERLAAQMGAAAALK